MGSVGEAHNRYAIFCNVLKKVAILMQLDHILHVFKVI